MRITGGQVFDLQEGFVRVVLGLDHQDSVTKCTYRAGEKEPVGTFVTTHRCCVKLSFRGSRKTGDDCTDEVFAVEDVVANVETMLCCGCGCGRIVCFSYMLQSTEQIVNSGPVDAFHCRDCLQGVHAAVPP